MRKVYAPLDVPIVQSNDRLNGPLIRTIYPNYLLLSIKILGMLFLITLGIRQLFWPDPKFPDFKIDFSQPFQGIFLPLFLLGILLYFLGREVFYISRKINLYYYTLEIKAIFFKKTYSYDEISNISKTYEEERIRVSNSGHAFLKKYFYEIVLKNGKKIKLAKRDFYNLEKWMENLKQNTLTE